MSRSSLSTYYINVNTNLQRIPMYAQSPNKFSFNVGPIAYRFP